MKRPMTNESLTILEKVQHLIREVPEASHNDKLLTLLYWRIYDGIQIPPAVMREILEKGAQPDSITRLKRKHELLSRGSSDIARQIQEFLEAVK